MSTITSKTVSAIADRTARICIEKPYGGIPSIMTVDEAVTIDGENVTSRITGNMVATYDPADPLDVALYAALEAKVLAMRGKRDAVEAK